MKKCTGCKHASWRRDAVGRRHPSGDGICSFEAKLPRLPASMYWLQGPRVGGGFINRNEVLPDHCPHFARETT